MRTIIKFNKNTDVKEIEKVIEAAVKKYVVKNDRYSTEANSQFEVTENSGFYDVEGKRINSHLIELQFGYDELADDDIYELTIDTHNIEEFEGYVDATEFSELVTVKEDKELVADDKEVTAAKESIKHAEKLFDDMTVESADVANEIIAQEEEKIAQLKKENKKMIIDTKKVEKMFESKTAKEIAELTGVSQRTIEKYKSGDLNWLGKNSVTLAETANEVINDEEMFWYNPDTNTLLNQKEYDELLVREAKEVWDDEDDDAHDNYDTFADFLKSMYESEEDFFPSDSDGNKLEEW